MIQVQVLGCKQKSKQINVYNKSSIIFKRQLPLSGKTHLNVAKMKHRSKEKFLKVKICTGKKKVDK